MSAGSAVPVILKEQQKHPLRDEVMHIDLLQVNLREKIQSTVAVELRCEEEPQGRQPQADRQVHPDQGELARPPGPGQDRDLVEEVRDGVGRPVEPAGLSPLGGSKRTHGEAGAFRAARPHGLATVTRVEQTHRGRVQELLREAAADAT